MRLVDADALLEATRNFCDGYKVNWTDSKVLTWIDHAPTIDAVPVVRCKDCNRGHLKHMRGEPCIECQLFHYEDPRQYKDLMDYCSHGVRKDGER